MQTLNRCPNVLRGLRAEFPFRVALLLLLLLLFLSPWSRAQTPCTPGASVNCLDQGWTDAQRQQFYTLSQGSQLIPLAWFRALERPQGEDLFLSDGLARFGYLPNPQNPAGLPVGFTEDHASGDWAGLTCAACHTAQVEYHGAVIRIDGGPTSADAFAFITELNAAVRATLDDIEKFSRFAQRAGATDAKQQRDLRNQVVRFSAYFSTFIDASAHDVPWGPARADAFGMIFNRVSAIDDSAAPLWAWFQPLESNYQVPNAPVSYPFLWGISRLDYVQWNASAKNTDPLARLGRNVGEALGVFGRVNLKKPSGTSRGYPSSVNASNQYLIEEKLIKYLKSPQWPTSVLGEIDEAKKQAGSDLYKKYCMNCHVLLDRNGTAAVKIHTEPVTAVNTDPTMAMNVACRMSDTGILNGVRQPPILGLGYKLAPTDFSLKLVSNVAVGVLEDWIFSRQALAVVTQGGAAASPAAHPRVATPAPPPAQASPQFPATQVVRNAYRVEVATENNCMKDLEVYKAGPLNGIWATAPFLHNGSVPNLYQLLLPPDDRVKNFKVGSREFDPVNVGFDSTNGSFDLDTSLLGNSNQGHEYATKVLTEEQRWQLVEFLKSL